MNKLDTCPMCHGQTFDALQYDTNPNEIKAGWAEQHCFKNKTIAVCRSCGGGFTHEYLSDEEIGDFYSSIFTDPRYLGKIPAITELNEFTPRFFSQAMYLKSFIHLYDGMRILELGPNVVSALPSLNIFCTPQYCYFDQLESPIIKAYGGRRLGSYASGENIASALSNGSVDLIYSSHSLEHVNPSSLEKMFEAFSQVTASGGYLFFEVPDDYGYKCLVPPHTLFFTTASIQKLVERYGFEIIDISRWDGGARWDGGKASNTPENCGTEPENKPSIGIAAQLRAFLRNILLRNATFAKAYKRRIFRLALARAMREIPTPYEAIPFYRLLARRKAS